MSWSSRPRWLGALAIALLLAGIPLLASGTAGTITVRWDLNTTDTDVAGYRIYLSTDPGVFSLTPAQAAAVATTRQVGPAVTETVFTGLDPAQVYWIAVTSVDTSDNEGIFSNVVSASPVDSTPPVVSITFPSAGATVSGAVVLSASASDDVAVAGVQFRLDGADLGPEATSSPFTVSWDTATTAPGAHTLTAVARDAAGNTATSTGVAVTVSAPVSCGVTPLPGTPEGFGSGTTGGAGYPVVCVTNLNDSGPGSLREALTGSNRRIHFAVGGTIQLLSRLDMTGQSNVTVDGSTAPSLGITLKGQSFQIKNSNNVIVRHLRSRDVADTADNLNGFVVWQSCDRVWLDHLSVSRASDDSILVYEGPTNVTVSYCLVYDAASATDPSPEGMLISGANGTYADRVTVHHCVLSRNYERNPQVSGDLAAGPGPTVDMRNNIIHDWGAGGYGTRFRWNATGNVVDNIYRSSLSPANALVIDQPGDLYASGNDAPVDIDALSTVSSPVAAPPVTQHTIAQMMQPLGSNVLLDNVGAWPRDTVDDAAVAGVMAALVSTPDTTPPAVSITSPTSGATVQGTVSVNAAASDNVGVAGVQFTLDGTSLGSEDTSAPYSIAWDTLPVPNGTHTLAAVARDAAGNTTTSSPIVVTVGNPDTTPPAVSITAPASGATVQGSVSVDAAASDDVGVAGVQFTLDGTSLGPEDTSAPYSIAWNTVQVPNGAHTLAAVARDAAGNTATATVTVTVSNPDVTPPAVSMMAPGAGWTVGGMVSVTATATDDVGVAGVQFKLDGANLDAEDTASPYSISWNTLSVSNGPHTLTAVARDAAGNTATASPVTVTVSNPDTTPPVVSITAPASGATVQGTVPVSAAASDNVGVTGVQFRLDGANLEAEDTGAPYGISWNTLSASNGTHTLTAVARDAANNTTTSASIVVTVSNPDTTAPSVSITSPTSGATVQGTVPVSATASDNVGVAGVQFRLDGANLEAEDTGAPYGISWNTLSASNGTHTLTAVARDAAGNTATAASVTVTVSNPDTTAPSVSITSPTSGATVQGAISVSATASDNVGVAGVQFRLDGAGLGLEDTSAPYAVSWNTLSVSNGPHTLTATARDAAGNTATAASVIVTVGNPDTTAPIVSMTAPGDGWTVGGMVSVAASATDNVGVAGVQFKLDGANLGAEDTTSPFATSWNTLSASNGPHTLTAVARDAAGNTMTAASVTVTVSNPDTTAPTISLTAPSSGATVQGTVPVTATASDNVGVAGVQFKLDGANLEAEDTVPPYDISWNTLSASNGTHMLTAVARDAAGNTTTAATITVTVSNTDTTAPSVSITSPISGATVQGTVSLSASASDNVGIGGVRFRLDGTDLGPEDTTSPYGIAWSTVTAANGQHALTAVARDLAGNTTTSSPVTVTVANSDTTAPTVSMTAPSPGATVQGTVSLTAAASDNVGVAGVQFRLDGANLGAEDTSAPYATSWNTLPASNGTHTLTAVARDAAGNTATAASVTVTVSNPDTTAPSVTLTAPGSGWTVGGTVGLTADASDDVGVAGVQFRLDGANLGAEDTSAPWTAAWNTLAGSNGSHTLTAVARDAAGNTTTSSAVTVTVANADTAAPTVSLTAPTSGATVLGTLSVTATASDNVGVAGVQFGLDGANLGAEDTSAPYTVSWNTLSASNGAHTLTAVARDAAGNTTTSSAVTVTVANADTTSPSVAITAPGTGWTVGGMVSVTADASDDVGVAGVQFRLDGANLGSEDTIAPYSTSWNTASVTNGSHTLTAVARDAAGNTTTSSAVTVTVANSDAIPPVVSLTGPASGATLTGTVTVSADASDNITVAGVQFRLDGADLGAEDTSAPYTVSWNTLSASNGAHTLTAVARDAAGNSTTAAAVTVTVANADTTSPSVAITAPVTGWTVGGMVSVTAAAADNVAVTGVQFRLDGTNLGAEDTTTPWTVAWNTLLVPNGPHTLTAVARDAAGNTATSAPVTVTVANPDTTAPSVTLTAPSSGSTLLGTVTVSATASDNVGVAGVQFRLDGANLGAEDTSAPYGISWDTLSAANGTHTLTAVARDPAGNVTTSSSVTVTVANPDTTPPQAPTNARFKY